MNLSDLRTELDRQADRIDGAGGLPLPAIRRRARGIRRRRLLTTAVAVALVATGVPLALDAATHRTQPPTVGTPAQYPDVIQDGVHYRGSVDGDSLLKTVIGEAGQNEITFTWTAPDEQTEIRPFCIDPQYVPPRGDPFDAPYWAVVRSGERVLMSTPCVQDGGKDPGDAPNWQSLKPVFRQLPRAKTARISIRLGDTTNAPRTNPRIRLGLGIYRVGPMRIVDYDGEGAAIPEVLDRDGKFYRLIDVATTGATGSSVTLPTMADTNLLLLFGGVQLSSAPPGSRQPEARTIRLTGVDPPVVQSSRDGMPDPTQVPLAPRPDGTVTASYTGSSNPGGLVLLAVYMQT